MDFEDSGIDSDPKANSEKEFLTQHNEPIISFSPERCRFDSTTSSSRKSSTSFPISVADLHLDESPPSLPLLASCNSPPINFQTSSNITTSNCLAGNSISSQKLNEHAIKPQQQIPFANSHHSQPANFPKHSLSQAYPFVLNQQQKQASSPLVSLVTSSSIPFSTALQGPASLIISTHATTSSTICTTATHPKTIPTTTSPSKTLDSHSVPLMVNGAVLNANTSSNSTTPATSLSSTTLDLQKRLEKRIAQASAIAAAAAAATSSSPSIPVATSSNSLSSTAPPKTKGSESVLSDIISNNGVITNRALARNASNISIEPHTPNLSAETKPEISFSPQKTSLFTAACQEIDFQEGVIMPKSSSALWEPDPLSPTSTTDFWENKALLGPGSVDDFPKKGSTVESFIDVDRAHVKNEPTSLSITDFIGSEKSFETGNCATVDSIAELELTSHTTATTSCKTSTTSASGVATSTGDVNKTGTSDKNMSSINKSATSKNNRPKGNQSCRNNNSIKASSNGTENGDVTGELKTATSPFACGNSGTGGSITTGSLPSATAVTVVNASFDIRKVSALIPPQRLAIPSKSSHLQLQSSRSVSTTSKSKGAVVVSNTPPSSGTTFSAFGSCSNDALDNPTLSSATYESSTCAPNVHKSSTRSRPGSISETSCSGGTHPPSGNGNIRVGSNNSSKLSTDSEKKPLVQWDSDESEEELSFFPPAKRGVITDNLSVDNMSLSGEEDDLHLTPPRPLSKKCPCDPRTWMDRGDISSGHHHSDPTRSISSKYSCIIS